MNKSPLWRTCCASPGAVLQCNCGRGIVTTFNKWKQENCRLTKSGGNGQIEKILRLFFTGLIGNTAGGLARGLAGSLAFAAAAVLCALRKVSGFNGLDSLHNICNSLNILIAKVLYNMYFPFVNSSPKNTRQIGDKTEKCPGASSISLCSATPWDASASRYAKTSRSSRSPGTTKGIPGGYA